MLRRVLTLLLAGLAIVPLQVLAQGLAVDRPNDPEYGKQWHLGKIAASCAWRHTIGSAEVLVAVVDTGVDLQHPDLAPNIAASGYDFVDDDRDPSDLNGHGTNVAGIIAAVTHNAQGVASVAGGVRILPIRVLDAEGAGSDSALASGIRYAVDAGARVINLSLGSALPTESTAAVEAIRYAHSEGALVVIAAGNSYLPIPNFSLGMEEYALVVAATDPQDRKTDFSNYGPWVGISAPGHRIYSTMPTYDVFLTSDALPPDQRFKNNYDAMSGTSQATPVVSAIAALIFSAHPSWSADQVKAQLQHTASDIGSQNPRSRVFRPEHLGAGRVNACRALGGASGAEAVAAAGPDAASPSLALLAGALLAFVALLAAAGALLRRRSRPPIPQSFGGYPPAAPGLSPSGGPAARQSAPPAQSPAGAPRAAPSAAGRLVIAQGPGRGHSVRISAPVMHLGRSSDNAIALSEDPAVSRRHARLTLQGSQLIVEDLGSTHGTFINGQRITRPTLLRPGDTLHTGQTTLLYEA